MTDETHIIEGDEAAHFRKFALMIMTKGSIEEHSRKKCNLYVLETGVDLMIKADASSLSNSIKLQGNGWGARAFFDVPKYLIPKKHFRLTDFTGEVHTIPEVGFHATHLPLFDQCAFRLMQERSDRCKESYEFVYLYWLLLFGEINTGLGILRTGSRSKYDTDMVMTKMVTSG